MQQALMNAKPLLILPIAELIVNELVIKIIMNSWNVSEIQYRKWNIISVWVLIDGEILYKINKMKSWGKSSSGFLILMDNVTK